MAMRTEAHEFDRETERLPPKAMIGHRMSQDEAKRLLAKVRLTKVKSSHQLRTMNEMAFRIDAVSSRRNHPRKVASSAD